MITKSEVYNEKRTYYDTREHKHSEKKMKNKKKFSNKQYTISGEKRAFVELMGLETLWLNTGTLCNLSCKDCYIESSPRNDKTPLFNT